MSQFGFALSFSMVFTFHQVLAANQYFANFFHWLFLLPISYLVFLLLMMEIIPW